MDIELSEKDREIILKLIKVFEVLNERWKDFNTIIAPWSGFRIKKERDD